ncbi:MAG: putative glycoside hydrolase, partial [Candidatus Uhrbacteria bacterium]
MEMVPVSEVRALYLTSGIAASDRFEHFLDLLDSTEVNALVIDLKDANGRLAFRPVTDPIIQIVPERQKIRDLPRRIDAIHRNGGLAIARIAVFQDTWYAEKFPSEALHRSDGSLWRDQIGYAWLDPASPQVIQYAIDLAYEAVALGFDEVNFDYIRFPSDGALNRIVYPHWDRVTPRVEVIESFVKRIDTEVRQHGVRTSADIFGMSFYAVDGMGIGQQLERIAPYFDALAPMVYPSHYSAGFGGFSDPAANPYGVIAQTLAHGVPRILALPEAQQPAVRPWLQDFNLGAMYDDAMVRAQQQAVIDQTGTESWMIWNPLGRYHEGALDSQ